MSSEDIIGLVIFSLVALIMIGIGIVQYISKEPVGFYTGQMPPKATELTDVTAWNKKHGSMWIMYGIVMLAGYFISYQMGDTILAAIPMCGGVILPLPVMIGYHHILHKRYYMK